MAETQTSRRESSRLKRNVSKMAFRSKEKVLRSIGIVEETKDEILDHYAVLINKQQAQMHKLQRELKQYIQSIKAMGQAHNAFFQSLYDVYDDDWAQKDAIASLSQHSRQLHEDLCNELNTEISAALQSHLGQYKTAKVTVDKRGRKLVDYDVSRRTLYSLKNAKKPDAYKIDKAQEHENLSKDLYELLNNQLHDQLPTLYDSRLPTTCKTYQNICEAEQKFYSEIINIRLKLQSILGNTCTAFENGEYHIQRMKPTIKHKESATLPAGGHQQVELHTSGSAVDVNEATHVNGFDEVKTKDTSTHDYINLQVNTNPDEKSDDTPPQREDYVMASDYEKSTPPTPIARTKTSTSNEQNPEASIPKPLPRTAIYGNIDDESTQQSSVEEAIDESHHHDGVKSHGSSKKKSLLAMLGLKKNEHDVKTANETSKKATFKSQEKFKVLEEGQKIEEEDIKANEEEHEENQSSMAEAKTSAQVGNLSFHGDVFNASHDDNDGGKELSDADNLNSENSTDQCVDDQNSDQNYFFDAIEKKSSISNSDSTTSIEAMQQFANSYENVDISVPMEEENSIATEAADKDTVNFTDNNADTVNDNTAASDMETNSTSEVESESEEEQSKMILSELAKVDEKIKMLKQKQQSPEDVSRTQNHDNLVSDKSENMKNPSTEECPATMVENKEPESDFTIDLSSGDENDEAVLSEIGSVDEQFKIRNNQSDLEDSFQVNQADNESKSFDDFQDAHEHLSNEIAENSKGISENSAPPSHENVEIGEGKVLPKLQYEENNVVLHENDSAEKSGEDLKPEATGDDIQSDKNVKPEVRFSPETTIFETEGVTKRGDLNTEDASSSSESGEYDHLNNDDEDDNLEKPQKESSEQQPIYEEPPDDLGKSKPQKHVSQENNQSNKKNMDLPPNYLNSVKALYKYESTDEDELAFNKGEIIHVVQFPIPEEQDDGWEMGIKQSDWEEHADLERYMGVFPENFTKKVDL